MEFQFIFIKKINFCIKFQFIFIKIFIFNYFKCSEKNFTFEGAYFCVTIPTACELILDVNYVSLALPE